MTSGLTISQDFIRQILLPLLRQEMPDVFDRLAVAVVGTDVLGLDDAISRDHHWGPRATVMYVRADSQQVRPALQATLKKVPAKYEGFDVRFDVGNLTGVCCSEVESFFGRFLGTEDLPVRDLDWLNLCEVELFHVTAGTIVYDGAGELTRRCDQLAYYPENVWKKRIADWCMYVTGRDAPYNLHRVSRRQDDLTCAIYFGLCLKRLMELCFALNGQYAPYTKWLNRLFRKLPKYADKLAPLIDQAVADSAWDKRVEILIEANYVIAEAISDLQLADQPRRREFDDGLTDLTLYDSARQIYEGLPAELLGPSFNSLELWERVAREVLFDANDYLKNTDDN